MIQDGYSLILHDKADIDLESRQINVNLSGPQVTSLVRLWERSRAEYLHWILARKGSSKEQARVNTRNTYRIAMEQFFDGIWPKFHPQHEAEMVQQGYDVVPIWPELVPWNVTSTTARQYKDILAQYGKPVKGSVELESGKRVRSEVERTGLGESSINVKLAALKTYFDFLVSQFEIPYRPHEHELLLRAGLLFPDETGRKVLLWSTSWRNPFDPNIVSPYKISNTPVFLTEDEVEAIFAQINTDCLTGIRDFALLLTIWSTACRVSEVLNLCWGDIKPKGDGNFTFGFRGKSGKYERVELQAEAYQVIVRYLQVTDQLDTMEPASPVFTAVDQDRILRIDAVREMYPDGVPDKAISYSTVDQMFKKYAARAGVPVEKAHLHALRHGRGRQMLRGMKAKNGTVNIFEINKILRHSSLDMTKHYTDMLDDVEDPWAKDAIKVALSGRKGKQAKAEGQEALPGMSPAEVEVIRLKAEIAKLKEQLGE